MEKLNQEEIKSKAFSDAQMKIETSDFRKLSRNDLLNYAKRFQVVLHHLKKNGYNEQLAMQEFQRDGKELLEKFAKQGQLNLIEAQQTWKEGAKEAWEIFKRTIAPYWGEDMMKWNHKFHDTVSGAKTGTIEEHVKEIFLDSITSDFTSMKEADFKRKLIKRFESRALVISIDRQIHMSEDDAKDLRIGEGELRSEDLFFRREITLKPRLRR